MGAAIRAQQRRTLRQTPPLQTRRTPHDTGAQLRTLRQTPPLQTRRIAHPTCVTDDIGRAAAAIAPLCADAAAAVGLLITPAPLATSSTMTNTAILMPPDMPFMLALLPNQDNNPILFWWRAWGESRPGNSGATLIADGVANRS